MGEIRFLISTKYKYAGDFELWMRFFKYAEQYITPALIGVIQMSLKSRYQKGIMDLT